MQTGRVLAALVILMTSACAGSIPTASPETAAPTAASSPTATVGPTPSSTPSPTPGPTLIPYPGPPVPSGTTRITIAAHQHLKFDRTGLSAPADTPFVIAFENRDVCDAKCQSAYKTTQTSIAHNVAIKLGDVLVFNPLPAIGAPAVADYFISAGLPAGTYQFMCIVHPLQMRGTLTIQ